MGLIRVAILNEDGQIFNVIVASDTDDLSWLKAGAHKVECDDQVRPGDTVRDALKIALSAEGRTSRDLGRESLRAADVIQSDVEVKSDREG